MTQVSCTTFRTCLGGAGVASVGRGAPGFNINDPWSKQSSFSWTLPCLMLAVLNQMFSPTISADGWTLIPCETQTSPHHRRSGTGIRLRLPFTLDPEGLCRSARRVAQHRGGATCASDRQASEEDPESRDVAKRGDGILLEFLNASRTLRHRRYRCQRSRWLYWVVERRQHYAHLSSERKACDTG